MFAKFANIVPGCKKIYIVNRGNKLVHSRVLSSRLDGINRSGSIERNVWSLKRPGGIKMEVRAATFWSGSSVHHRIALELLAVRGADGSQYVSWTVVFPSNSAGYCEVQENIDHLGSEHFQADSMWLRNIEQVGSYWNVVNFHTVQGTHEDECCREPSCCRYLTLPSLPTGCEVFTPLRFI